jgi:hypothetical protein
VINSENDPVNGICKSSRVMSPTLSGVDVLNVCPLDV